MIFKKSELKKLKVSAYNSNYNGFSNFPAFFNNLQHKNSEPIHIQKLIDHDLKILMNNDTQYNSNPLWFNEDKGIFSNRYKEICKSFASEFQLSIDKFPPCYIVDELPSELVGNQWEAMFIDKGDSEKLKLNEGIYYKSSSLTPVYFDFIIAHELIHWLISFFSKTYKPFVPIEEEGICDILGAFLLFKNNLVNLCETSNFFFYNRITKNFDSLWNSYYHSALNVLSSSSDILPLIPKIKELGRNNLLLTQFNSAKFDKRFISFSNTIIKASATRLLSKDEYVVFDLLVTFFPEKSFSLVDVLDTCVDLNSIDINNILNSIISKGLLFKLKSDLFYQPNFSKELFRYE